jgi:Flp pilus assembly protein TadG
MPANAQKLTNMNRINQASESNTTLCDRVLSPFQRERILYRRKKNSHGLATVELALCLPLLALLVFGSIEAASFIFLKQSLQVAAYEGIREAIRPGASDSTAVSRATAILNSRFIRDANVRFASGSVASLSRGQQVVIEVSAPTRTNSPLAGQWVSNRTLTTRLVMLKE